MVKGKQDWIGRHKNNQILISFSTPKTPTQVKEELNISKFSLKPFLKRHLIKCLNHETYKGRFYVLTNKARKLLKISKCKSKGVKDWELVGFILASPRQRYVNLKTLAVDLVKRTSEEISRRQ